MLSHLGTSGLAAINGSHRLELGARSGGRKKRTQVTTFSMTLPKFAFFFHKNRHINTGPCPENPKDQISNTANTRENNHVV